MGDHGFFRDAVGRGLVVVEGEEVDGSSQQPSGVCGRVMQPYKENGMEYVDWSSNKQPSSPPPPPPPRAEEQSGGKKRRKRRFARSPHPGEVILGYSTAFLFCLFMCIRVYQTPWMEWVGFTLCGMALYTFIEYWFHRTILHVFLRKAHANHHTRPRLIRIITTPILPVYVYDMCILAIVRGLLGVRVAAGINCGIAVGQMCMDIAHMLFHSRWRPWYLESARSYHNHHHFQGSDEAHGLTTPFWDVIFGTSPHSWPMYKNRPYLRYLQLPFPLVSFIIMAFLSNQKGRTTRTSAKGDAFAFTDGISWATTFIGGLVCCFVLL